MRTPSLRRLVTLAMLALLGLWLHGATAQAQTSWDAFHQAVDGFEHEKAMELARALPEGGPRELAVAEAAVLWARPDLSFAQTDKVNPRTLPPQLLSKYFLVRAYQERASEYPSQDEKDRAVSQMILSGLRSAGPPHDRAQLLLLQIAQARPPDGLGQGREAAKALAQLDGADAKFALLGQARLAVKEERFSEAAILLRSLADNAGLRGQQRAQFLLSWEAMDAESKIPERAYQVLRAAQELFERTVVANDSHAASLVYLVLYRLTPAEDKPALARLGKETLTRLDDSYGKLALIRRMAMVSEAEKLPLFRLGAEVAHRVKEPLLEADFLLLTGYELPSAERDALHKTARSLVVSLDLRGLGATWYGPSRTLLHEPKLFEAEDGLAGLRRELEALDPAKGARPRAELYGRYLGDAVREVDAPLAETIHTMAFEEAKALPPTRRGEFLDFWFFGMEYISDWKARAVAPGNAEDFALALADSLREKLAGRPDLVEAIFEGVLARPTNSMRDLSGWLSYLGRHGEALELLSAGLEEAPPGQKLAFTFFLARARLKAGDGAGANFLKDNRFERHAPWQDWLPLGWAASQLDQAGLAEECARLALANPPTEYVDMYRYKGPHLLLATALAAQGKTEQALEALDQGWKVDEAGPVYGKINYQLARLDILWQAGRKAEALALLGELRPLTELRRNTYEWRLRSTIARATGDQAALSELDGMARDFLALPTSQPEDPITARHLRAALGMAGESAQVTTPPRPLSDLVESVERLRRREPENVALQSLSVAALRQMMERAGPREIDVVAVLLQRSVLLVYLTREECGLVEVFCHRPGMDAALKTLSARLSSYETVPPEQERRYLSERLVQPWRARFPSKTELCWTGHDSLRQLPLSALPDSDGRPLMESLAITYLDGPGRGEVKLSGQTPALLLGGASDLQGSERELRAVRDLFPKGGSWTLGGDMQILKTLVAQHPIMHVSTHGAPPNRDNLGARLQGDQQTLDAFNLANLTFPPNSLAVIATCESFIDAGTGHDNSSLVSALRTAGASVVLGSLWELDDEVTAVLFQEFYRQLAQGASPDKALALAQRATAEKWKHPYYWAGLQVVSGP